MGYNIPDGLSYQDLIHIGEVDDPNEWREELAEHICDKLFEDYELYDPRYVYENRVSFSTTFDDEYKTYTIETEPFDSNTIDLEGIEGLTYDEAVEKFGEKTLLQELGWAVGDLCVKTAERFAYDEY